MTYKIMTVEDIETILPLYIDYYNNHEDSCWTQETAYKRIHQVLSMEDSCAVFLEEKDKGIGTEFPKNISHKDSMEPYAVMGFGALICVLIVMTSGIDSDGEDGGRGVDDVKYTSELMLNEDGYSMDYVMLPEDERYYEYYYVPADKDETYTYNVKIYDYGIGVVTIFPNESTGKVFNQVFSFYLKYDNLEPLIKDRKIYDFAEVAGVTENSETAEGTVDYEYLYYYDGDERIGSGGYGVESEDFDIIVEHIKAAVPQGVWRAMKDEMRRYYE